MSTVLLTYQSFGYGPLMKLLKFVCESRDRSFMKNAVIIAHGKDKHIININRESFPCRVVFYSNEQEKLVLLRRQKHAQSIISFYDHHGIIWAASENIPVRIAVDGLFHLWQIPPDGQQKLYRRLTHMNFGELWEYQDSQMTDNPHQSIMLQHYFATHSFIANYHGAQEKIRDFVSLGLINLAGSFDFMPLPESLSATITGEVGEYILVNFGGAKYPVTTITQEIAYYQLCALILNRCGKRLNELFGTQNMLVTVHPELLSVAQSLIKHPSAIILSSLSLKEYSHVITDASLILTAPGNTAAFESVARHKPVFLLPEKHIEQLNFVRLVNDTFANCSIYDYLTNQGVVNSSERNIVQHITEAALRIIDDPERYITQVIQRFEHACEDKEYVTKQQSTLQRIYGSEKGTAQLVSGIEHILEQGK